MTYIWMVLIGLAAGVCSGLFGIGGGVIIVSVLVLLMDYSQKQANATSLVALILPVGALGVYRYYQAGYLGKDNFKSGVLIALGIFIGTLLGSQLAVDLPEKLLSRSFAVFLVVIAVRTWFAKG